MSLSNGLLLAGCLAIVAGVVSLVETVLAWRRKSAEADALRAQVAARDALAAKERAIGSQETKLVRAQLDADATMRGGPPTDLGDLFVEARGQREKLARAEDEEVTVRLERSKP